MKNNLILRKIQDMKFMIRLDSCYSDARILRQVITNNCYLTHPRLSIKAGDLVVDIGAHIGSFTIQAAKMGARVFAYEPEPGNYELLKTNIALNGVEKLVSAYQLAIMTYTGMGELKFNARNFGGHTLCGNLSGPKIKVDVLDFSEIQNSKMIDFLKMDCEGCEIPILLKSDLSRVKQISAELHMDKHQAIKIATRLEKEGFELLKKIIISRNLGCLQAIKKGA